jgi:hypothetical protein
MSLTLRPVDLRFRIDSDGKRRIDLELIPFPSDTIECVRADSTQRSIIGDVDNEKWYDRLCERVKGAHVTTIACTIGEQVPAAQELGPDEHPYLGSADLSRGNPQLWLLASPSAFEELLRQDGVGRKIGYLQVDIQGLESAFGEASEGGLIAYRWHERTEAGHKRSGTVTSYDINYYNSAAYVDHVPSPPAPSRGDLESLTDVVRTLLGETKGIGSLLKILCLLTAAVIAVLVWRR